MVPFACELMPDLDRETILREAKPFDPLTHLEDFSRRFPSAIRLLRIGGVHPTEDAKMDNPYTGKPHDESFTNVGEHCFAVASLANILAFKLHEKGAMPREEAELVTSRALVHDASKRFEIMRRNALRESVVEEAYTPKAYETIRPILQAQGIDQELIDYMALAGKETGHLSIKDFLVQSNGIPSLVPGRMIDKIVRLADDTTSTNIPKEGERPLTVFLTPWERMVTSDFPSRYPFLWKEGLAFNKGNEVVPVQDIATADRQLRWTRHFALWQVFVSNEICREIQGIIDPKSTQKPEYFVKDLVNNILAPAV